MAAAEARAAWQRTANRCFVQEDAKRAPKLACCPSSCAQQHDSSNSNGTNGQDHHAPNFIPLNWYPMHTNLPPDTKWWLQLQPNFGYQKDFTCEQLNPLEDELLEMKPEPKISDPMNIDSRKNEYPFEPPGMVSTAFMKSESDKRAEEKKTLKLDGELMDWRSVDGLYPRKPDKASLDLETPWEGGGNKCEPWWRIADKDELASLVAQKSQEHIENCDLPKPTQISKDPFACLEGFDSNKIFSSSLGRKLHSGMCNPVDYAPYISASGSFDEKHSSSWDLGCSLHDTEKLPSGTYTCGSSFKDPPETRLTPEADPSRAQLLEALRHSQTRAREAEMAAQKAYNEKEHIVKLLFRQASHLFAYKQWLHMLQLENLYLQLRIKDNQIPTLFPALPWTPLKGKPSRKGKKQQKRCNICKYVVAFVVGLGLAGAGLLLGWTLGWLLPAF